MPYLPIVVKALKMLFPLLKEYFSTTGDKKINFFSYQMLVVVVIVSLVFCSTVTIYLVEQAKQNLFIQEPIIKQFNDLSIENDNLKQQLTASHNGVFQCETRANKAMNDCQKTIAALEKRGKYEYDSKTKTMVLKPGS